MKTKTKQSNPIFTIRIPEFKQGTEHLLHNYNTGINRSYN
jgi:hypothetical protein